MSEERDRWRERLDDLVGKVRGWVESEHWVTKPYPKKMRDADGTVYEVPALFIQKGPTRLLLDPIAYDAAGIRGGRRPLPDADLRRHGEPLLGRRSLADSLRLP